MFYPGSQHFSIPDPDPDPNNFSSQIPVIKNKTTFFLAFYGFRQCCGSGSARIRNFLSDSEQALHLNKNRKKIIKLTLMIRQKHFL
jgi:hypothetical protein